MGLLPTPIKHDFEPLALSQFREMLPRWFVNQHEEHAALLDALSMLPYARALAYGTRAGGKRPCARVCQAAGANAQANLMIALQANGDPIGACWDALFMVAPAKDAFLYSATVYRKCATNDPHALIAFLERLPLIDQLPPDADRPKPPQTT